MVRIGLLAIEESVTIHELERLRSFLGLLDTHLAKSKEHWDRKIRKQARKIQDEQERDEFIDFSMPEYWEFEEYERILHNSLVVTIFAYVEHRLGWFCSTMQKRRKLPLSMRDLQGDDLSDRARKYLEKVCGFAFPSDSSEWNNIRRYEKLRHYIVHRGGEIPEEDKDAWQFARKHKLLTGIDTGRRASIAATSPFCEEALEDARRLFVSLHRQLNQSKAVQVNISTPPSPAPAPSSRPRGRGRAR